MMWGLSPIKYRFTSPHYRLSFMGDVSRLLKYSLGPGSFIFREDVYDFVVKYREGTSIAVGATVFRILDISE
jgi:hypothetical protein